MPDGRGKFKGWARAGLQTGARQFRGCFCLGWRGDFRGVELETGEYAVVRSVEEGKVALTVGDDGLLHAAKHP